MNRLKKLSEYYVSEDVPNDNLSWDEDKSWSVTVELGFSNKVTKQKTPQKEVVTVTAPNAAMAAINALSKYQGQNYNTLLKKCDYITVESVQQN
jgi:hypothetical protein